MGLDWRLFPPGFFVAPGKGHKSDAMLLPALHALIDDIDEIEVLEGPERLGWTTPDDAAETVGGWDTLRALADHGWVRIDDETDPLVAQVHITWEGRNAAR